MLPIWEHYMEGCEYSSKEWNKIQIAKYLDFRPDARPRHVINCIKTHPENLWLKNIMSDAIGK